jgi:hypothetical protein
MKRDEEGRTKTERLIDEAHEERRHDILAAVVITALLCLPIGVIIGWLTSSS